MLAPKACRMNPVYYFGWLCYRALFRFYFGWRVYNAERVPLTGWIGIALISAGVALVSGS